MPTVIHGQGTPPLGSPTEQVCGIGAFTPFPLQAAGMTLFADPAPLATPSAATSSSTQLSVVDAQPTDGPASGKVQSRIPSPAIA